MIKLEEGELMIYIARRHWFIFIGETILLVIFAIAPILFLFLPDDISVAVNKLVNGPLFDAPHFIFAWSAWLLVLWMAFVLFWTNYYLDVWVLTNHRVVDINQISLFVRHISSFRYNQIQDATVKVSGLIGTFIGFGTVEIRTASNETFSFNGVADPHYLKEQILSQHHKIYAYGKS